MNNNKKSFLVVVIAFILALVIAYVFVNKNKTSVVEEPVKQEVIEDITETKFNVSEDVNDVKTEKIIIEESKTVSDNLQKTTVQKQLIQKSETLKPEIENVEKTVSEQEKLYDVGIIKDSLTNEVVITREFKMESPAKYSFK